MAHLVQAEVDAQLKRENNLVEFEFIKDRPYNDLRYFIDITKVREQLGWEPKTTFNEGTFFFFFKYLNYFYELINKIINFFFLFKVCDALLHHI